MHPNGGRARSAGVAATPMVLALLVLFVPGASLAHGPAAGVAQAAGRDPQLRGLQRATGGPCAGAYRVVGTPFCTHGPDPRPAGRRLTTDVPARASVIEGPLPDAVACDGDGQSGKRIQTVYARTAAAPDRYAELLPEMRDWAAGVQTSFLTTAARTDGLRRPRWVTDAACRLDVARVVLSSAAAGSLGVMSAELAALGHDRADRKYLVWFDASRYCGIATIWSDDRAGPDNPSDTRTGYARVDTSCWGWAEAHEVMHLLGAVQDSAPHSTILQGGFGHCSDEHDVMCYPDATGVVMTTPCADAALERQYDCGNDDYFHTQPAPGSYLDTHWNAADSGWLARAMVALRTPVPRLARGAALPGTGGVPVVVRYANTPPLVDVERVDVQRSVAGAGWVIADHPAGGSWLRTTLAPDADHRFRARARIGDEPAGDWLTGPTRRAILRQDTHPSLTWNGAWSTVRSDSASGGTLHRSRRRGAELRFRTGAAEIVIVAPRGPGQGRIAVRIDGTRVATIDLYAPAAEPPTLVFARRLDPGRPHAVGLRNLGDRVSGPGGSQVDIDALALLMR